MITRNTNRDEHITVVPYCRYGQATQEKTIAIRKLCFWFNNKFNHTITDESIEQFLLHVRLFGATVYPDFPELGCYAIDGDKSFAISGKAGVSEIHYKGEVIYCRC